MGSKIKLKILLLAMLMLTPTEIMAQQSSIARQTETVASLQWVSEGMLDIREGQVLDLTDRRVLFHLVEVKNSLIFYKINGGYSRLDMGSRLDLKKITSTSDTFRDMAECYLDLIGVTAPKGSAPIASFRFICH